VGIGSIFMSYSPFDKYEHDHRTADIEQPACGPPACMADGPGKEKSGDFLEENLFKGRFGNLKFSFP
jgi:hypothetical protein